MINNVEMVSVSKEKVVIRIHNVHLVFILNGIKKIRLIKKYKPDAKIHDPQACWVPVELYKKAISMAAAILKQKEEIKTLS